MTAPTISDEVLELRRIIFAWLNANGIDEVLPSEPTFVVQDESLVKRIIYRAFKFDGDERGMDMTKLSEGYFHLLKEDRSVPLVASLTDEVRAAFERAARLGKDDRAFLVEIRNGSSITADVDAYLERIGEKEAR